MKFFRRPECLVLPILLFLAAGIAIGQSSSSASGSSQSQRRTARRDSSLDPGTVTNGVYRNKTLGFTCIIPPGWVLRTDEMNAREEKSASTDADSSDSAKAGPAPASSASAKVLLAAFSRPPEAIAEDVNGSLLIAAESVASYPGLKEALQYFDPLTEVAKAQGFFMDEDPYEIAIGAKTLVRGDFHKNVGTRVMRQSTLAMLAHGYAISFTVIGGTDEEVEELIDGLDFQGSSTHTTPAPK
jgi:hypothetical protein